jgi:VWFA-related protein
MSRVWNPLTFLIAWAILQAGAAAAQPAGEFTDFTDVLLVEVPVQVVVKGEPVIGLSASNFELWDEKKKQRIITVDVVDLRQIDTGGSQIEDQAQPIPGAARRHFLLLFDLSFSSPVAVTRAREGALRLVRESLHPTDLVGVATWAESAGAKMVLNFTSDRNEVRKAIDTLGIADPIDRPRDPLRLAREELAQEASGEPAAGLFSDLSATQVLLTSLNDMQGMTTRVGLEQKQGQIFSMMDGMRRLAGWLQSVPGRVQVVLLSEGFDSTVLMGLSQDDEERRRELAQAVDYGQYWKVSAEERYGNQMALFGVTQTLEEFRRADAVIQAVDIGGLRTDTSVTAETSTGVSAAAIQQEALFLMANETGGELYRNYNDLGEAMGELLDRTSVTYVLTFQPDQMALDGSYHQLKVKVKGGPKGSQVMHRAGYYEPVPYGAADGEQRRIRNASLILGDYEGGTIEARSLAVPLPSGGERTPVAVLLEIDGPSLTRGAKPLTTLPVEVYAYALDREGRIHDHFAQAMGLDLDRSGPLLLSSGLKFWGELALDAGDYRLRILVRNSQVGSIHAESLALSVPGGAEDPTLLPPLFPDRPGSWMLGRVQDRSPSILENRFSCTGERALPDLRPTLHSDAVNQLCLIVYGWASDELTATAELREPSGSAVGTVEVKIAGREMSGDDALQLLAQVSPNGVPPGIYDLQVKLASGAVETTSSLPVRVAAEID